MWRRRVRRRVRQERVEFCDGCGGVCDAACRSAAIRTATRDRVLFLGAPR